MAEESNGRLDWLRGDLKELSKRLDDGIDGLRQEMALQFRELRGDMDGFRRDINKRLEADEDRLTAVEAQQATERAVRKVLGALALSGFGAALNLLFSWIRTSIGWRG